MEIIEYNKRGYRRKCQWYRFLLGLEQCINYPVINLIWILYGAGIYCLIILKQIIKDSVEAPSILIPIWNFCLQFIMIVFPIIIYVGTIQVIGFTTAIRDEGNVYRAFGDKRDIRNEPPILIKKKRKKGTKVTIREFYTTIPMNRWKENLEGILDRMDAHIVGELEYGGKSKNNGNRVYMETGKGRLNEKRGIMYDDTF